MNSFFTFGRKAWVGSEKSLVSTDREGVMETGISQKTGYRESPPRGGDSLQPKLRDTSRRIRYTDLRQLYLRTILMLAHAS